MMQQNYTTIKKMGFNVNDKVVCIETDPDKMTSERGTYNIVNGEEYDVVEGEHEAYGYVWITVSASDSYWLKSSFRKVEPKPSFSNKDTRKLVRQFKEFDCIPELEPTKTK